MDGQLGLEQTPEEYVAEMVGVFREVWRVLRDDGVLWLNLGSTFASGARTSYDTDAKHAGRGGTFRPGAGRADGVVDERAQRNRDGVPTPPGYKPKDLVPIPWLVALALQQDGWYLRSDIIWAKGCSFGPYAGNPMPESVTDRPTCAHEYVFLLTKRERYFFDQEAVKTPCAVAPHAPGNKANNGRLTASMGHCEQPERTWASDGKRNIRSVWTIPTRSFPGSHFATFPPALVEPCVKAGTSERGCCPQCGKQWERVVKREKHPSRNMEAQREQARASTGRTDGHISGPGGMCDATRTLGFRPACDCDAGEPVPAVVLDPFFGAGTVGLVCEQLGRDWIGCELNHEYAKLAQVRITAGGDLRAKIANEKQEAAGQVPLFDA